MLGDNQKYVSSMRMYCVFGSAEKGVSDNSPAVDICNCAKIGVEEAVSAIIFDREVIDGPIFVFV